MISLHPRICHMPDGLQPFLFAYVTAIRPFLFLATARIRTVLRAVLRILGGKRIRRIRRNQLSYCPYSCTVQLSFNWAWDLAFEIENIYSSESHIEYFLNLEHL